MRKRKKERAMRERENGQKNNSGEEIQLKRREEF